MATCCSAVQPAISLAFTVVWSSDLSCSKPRSLHNYTGKLIIPPTLSAWKQDTYYFLCSYTRRQAFRCENKSTEEICVHWMEQAHTTSTQSPGSINNIHLYISTISIFVFSVLICSSSVFCILALGSGQRLLYRLGSGLVFVLRFCAYSYGGVYS